MRLTNWFKTMGMFERANQSLITNDDYVVSDGFCNPLQVKKDINMIEGW